MEVVGLRLAENIDGHLPAPGSGAGYAPSVFVVPLMLMLHGGGRALEDLREVRADTGLRELLSLREIPSTDAVGDWLRRTGSGRGLAGLGAVSREVVARALAVEARGDYTLDIDATLIAAEKREAAWTYKGFKGYAPMVGHLAENGLAIHDEFRPGNDAPQARNLEFVRSCAARMPAGKRITRLRSDSAAYQAAVRWKLYQVAGKVVMHGNRVWLKVGRLWLELVSEVRRRC